MANAHTCRARCLAVLTLTLAGGTAFSTCESTLRTATMGTIRNAAFDAIDPEAWLSGLGYTLDPSAGEAGETTDTP